MHAVLYPVSNSSDILSNNPWEESHTRVKGGPYRCLNVLFVVSLEWLRLNLFHPWLITDINLLNIESNQRSVFR